ncbi:MAG: prolyl oligopeptidase family serine peptidase [Erythrobacter sp.]|jgi:prolyl oligopeptidase|uniref:prolyl oligopeptidase family serine peptidase n=1 Tax=Qipengyuania citrea TaxID=225971 RepID=UPI00209E1548|nr:prolyl oligopeptidase family serine peptidase [Qipengyuania citrea]MCP2017331.1 prolyl oligopeptidase [Qipengyuania citrea]MDE0901433.1 prolyl oligopeptidase family serine peptidase [Erythrobacter sp.]
MVARLALAAALVFTAAPIAAQEGDAEDSHIWLEEIQGERALAKVDQWNADTEAVLTAQAEYPLAKAWARQILDDTRQIAMPDAIMGDQVTNLWRDADNPRGLWRTATLESYLAGAPEWRTLIDVDQLGEDEGQSWVWHGANCLAPEYTRCLVSLSPGGTDADVVREFDIATGAFVEGGFTLPEAKSNVAWYDENTLFVGTDEGDGSLTDSGYPRLVKLWERGTDFAQARLIAEGEQTDISMSGFSVLDGETRYRFVRRGPSFWTSEYALVTDSGDTVALPMPEDAEFEAVLGGFVIGKLNSPMETSAGTEQPGALLAWSLDDVLDGGDPQPFAVLRPSETQAVEQVAASENKLWVKVLDDVSGKLIELTPGSDGWSARAMDLPANSTIQIAETTGTGDTAFVTVESMLTPPTLYAVPSDGSPVAIASEPAQFDASKFSVEQKFAISKDGTKVPYYLVRPKDAEGPLPTLIHAYGGFRAAQTPKYLTAEPYRSGPLGLFWVESGNAYVLANIRGGGEYGPRWHEDALREKRQNSFDDFHAVADDLVANRLATPGRIAASGRSNGGVLVGAVANQRPDLYGGIISGSPLIDMKRYNKLLAGASWMAEYGNPDVPADWAFMREWSPYQNMRDTPDVPAAFYYLSTLDDRVHPGHARKAAAKHEAWGQTFYYHEYREGGHSVGSDHEEDAKRAALLLAYLNREIGSGAD